MDKKNKVLDPREFFQISTVHKRSYRFPDGVILDLNQGVPENCVDLYKNNFFYLKLKRGAEVLFEDLSELEVLQLINKTKSKNDIVILSKLIHSIEGKEIVAKRRKEL